MNYSNDENNPLQEEEQDIYSQAPYQGPVIYPEPPKKHIYEGSQGFATAALIMGILTLVSMCCFPPIAILFGALGIIFGVISKGSYTRPGNAKAGIAMSAAGLGIITALMLFFSSIAFSRPENRAFFSQYFHMIMNPEQYTEDEVYEFLYDFLYPEDDTDYMPYENEYIPSNDYDNVI